MRWLVIVALVVTAEQAAAKDDFCRDMWLKLDASGRAEFAAQSDAKAFANAAPDERPSMLACAAKDRPRLIRRLDAVCSSGAAVAPETVVAELMDHVERCASVLANDNTGTAAAGVLHESLSARVEKLESEVKALRQEVAALRAGGLQGALERRAPTPAGPPGWKNRANWRALRKGMNQEAVRGLLGEPDDVEVYGVWTDWEYGELHNGGGYVRFDPDSSRLNGWDEP